MEPTTRRRFLAGTALAGFGVAAGLGRTRPAGALSFEEPDAATAALYANRCSVDPVHRQLVSEVLARLDGKATPAEVEAVLSAATCPFCGCRLG
jgi:hypothetical protein